MTDVPPPSSPIAAAPVAARPAASLLILRGRSAGPEVLMGLRGAGHKFMPNRLVFPGGAVDPEDHAAPFATRPPTPVLHRLAKSGETAQAMAIAHAAARELEEETGLSLGRPPQLDGLDYLCRAITPASSPIRFDAHFLVVEEARVSGILAGSGELEGLRYYAVTEALALELAFATRYVLERLTAWLAMSKAQRQEQTTVAVLRNRAWTLE